jgi:hypothetical protein
MNYTPAPISYDDNLRGDFVHKENKRNKNFKIFGILKCNCSKESGIMTTDDGNRTQICTKCKKYLMRDGIKCN